MNAEDIDVYVCEECKTAHCEEIEASDCCPTGYTANVYSECGKCGEIHEDREEAEECCKEDKTPPHPQN